METSQPRTTVQSYDGYGGKNLVILSYPKMLESMTNENIDKDKNSMQCNVV